MKQNNIFSMLVVLAVSCYLPSNALALYLNKDNIEVKLGPNMDAETKIFERRTIEESLANVIDAPSADSPEIFNEFTEVWASGQSLELEFDLKQLYSLRTLHFWNFPFKAFNVDNIDLKFLDENRSDVAQASIQLTSVPPVGSQIFAQDFNLPSEETRYIIATFSGNSNPEQAVFLNVGFTPVPLPASIWLLIAGLASMGIVRKRADG